MPMSSGYEKSLFPRLPDIVSHFGTPFHIFDEQGIVQTGENLKALFVNVPGFREFFAVKAWPNPAALRIMKSLGFGLDCSSPSELVLARRNGTTGEDIMFSSNNTAPSLFDMALADGGCILNLDDISFIDKIADFPELICFRYNPGEKRTGNQIIGIPVEAKYGLTDAQVTAAYRRAMERGALRFGIHSMVISNERNYRFMVETVRMLMEVMERITAELGIRFEFFNISGGVGIPYRPDDTSFDMPAFAAEAKRLIEDFTARNGYTPKLFTEFGRYMTGPHGVLVTTVVNRMDKYRNYVGVDAATMCSNPRPPMYDAYHHITVLDPSGVPRRGSEETVDVVGPLCENNDKFAIQRRLPRAETGDILVQHDTGAHSPAMGGNYNGWLRPKELLLRTDGSVELIRRAETMEDLFATFDLKPDVLP